MALVYSSDTTSKREASSKQYNFGEVIELKYHGTCFINCTARILSSYGILSLHCSIILLVSSFYYWYLLGTARKTFISHGHSCKGFRAHDVVPSTLI